MPRNIRSIARAQVVFIRDSSRKLLQHFQGFANLGQLSAIRRMPDGKVIAAARSSFMSPRKLSRVSIQKLSQSQGEESVRGNGRRRRGSHRQQAAFDR